MNTRKLTYTGFFIALGIVLPQIFHMIGGPGIGSILLPMHIPVLMGAILLGPVSGLLIGLISVGVGFSLGMPALPMAGFMLFELSTYGLIAGYLGSTRKLNVYITMFFAMFSGRLVALGLMQFVITIVGIKLPPVFGTIGIFATGIPGMILHLVVIPPLVIILRRYMFSGQTVEAVENT